MIVFGCVADQLFGTVGGIDICYYGENGNACSFAIAVGVIGFLLSLAFIVKDVLYIIIDYSDSTVVSPCITMYLGLRVQGGPL